ncbi:MAG: hypothetical protein NZM42_07155 [Gemmatales bacterium]|nr:hypothetical protein [Gemmatales bacterium]
MMWPSSLLLGAVTDWLSRQWQLTLEVLHSQQRLVLVSAIAVIFSLWLMVRK